jgi:prevent-host-death family protein
MGDAVMSGIGRQAKILNKHQLNALLAWLDTRKHADRNRLIVLLSFKAGLRAKEIASLTWSMCMNADGKIGDHIHLTNEASKGSSGRIIALNKDLKAGGGNGAVSDRMDGAEPSSSAPLSSAGTRQTQVFGPVRAVCDCSYVQLGQHCIFGKRIRMRTFTSADAKNHFGELIDMARAAPVGITKYDRPVVVVVAVDGSIPSPRFVSSPKIGAIV